jgi:hypothetical protein
MSTYTTSSTPPPLMSASSSTKGRSSRWPTPTKFRPATPGTQTCHAAHRRRRRLPAADGLDLRPAGDGEDADHATGLPGVAHHDQVAVEHVNLKECRTLFSAANEILFELTGAKKGAYEGVDGVFGSIWAALEAAERAFEDTRGQALETGLDVSADALVRHK